MTEKKAETVSSVEWINDNSPIPHFRYGGKEYYVLNDSLDVEIGGVLYRVKSIYLAKSYEEEQKELTAEKTEIQRTLLSTEQDKEKLSKFIKVVKTYIECRELTQEILNSFVEKIIVSETEIYDGRKMQEVKIIYKFVGAINLPQYSHF